MLQDKRIIIAAVVAVIAIGWFMFPRGGPEAAINKRLDALFELVGKQGPESRITAISTARKIANHFTEDCIVASGQARISVESKDSLAGAMVSARDMADTIELGIRRRSITMNPGNESATMNLLVHVNADVRGARENGSGEYYLEWVKTPDGWNIRRVVPVQE